MPSGRKFGAEMSADASVRRFVAARAKNSPEPSQGASSLSRCQIRIPSSQGCRLLFGPLFNPVNGLALQSGCSRDIGNARA